VVENVGYDVQIASPSLSVQKLLPHPVWVIAILSLSRQRRAMTAVACLKSGMVENVG